VAAAAAPGRKRRFALTPSSYALQWTAILLLGVASP
jgi:hypothetical protein